MIKIREPIHGFLCQHCLDNKNVKEIAIRRDGVSVIIRLCAKCRKKLMEKLEKDAEQPDFTKNLFASGGNG